MLTTTTATTTTYQLSLNRNLDILFGITCCVCFLSGTIGNLAAFLFFKYSKNNVPHSIYNVITMTDFYVSLCILPTGLCYLMDRSPGVLFGNTVPCYIWGYTWNMAGRLSIFLVVVLSSTRTLLLLKPFCVVRIKVVISAIVGYFIFLFLQLLLIQLLMQATVLFKESYAECVFYTDPAQTKKYKALYFIGYTVPFIVPMFVVLVSCGFTMYAIAIKPKQNDSHTSALAASSARVTKTILIFTLVYSLFNIPLVFDRILLAVKALYVNFGYDPYNFEYVEYYLNFTYSISVAINSALNPWLYLWRMANFRRFLCEMVRKVVPTRCQNSVACGSPVGYRSGGKRGSTLFETTSFIHQ